MPSLAQNLSFTNDIWSCLLVRSTKKGRFFVCAAAANSLCTAPAFWGFDNNWFNFLFAWAWLWLFVWDFLDDSCVLHFLGASALLCDKANRLARTPRNIYIDE